MPPASRPMRHRLLVTPFPGVLALAVFTAICYRLHLTLATVTPLFLLAVILESLSGSVFWSALVSILAVGCLDFFFVDPLFSFVVRGRLNGVALTSFLMTSLVITKLVTRVRTEAGVSALQRHRIDRLYQLAQQLLALDPEVAMGERLLQLFTGVFGTRAVCIFDAETSELHTGGDSRAHLAERTRAAFVEERDSDDATEQVSVRQLRVGGKRTGAMGFEGLEDPELTSGPLITLAAASQERARAFRRASEAAAAAQAEGYRTALLDALAHEFKTPLATILAAAGGIRETGFLRSDQMEMAETVESEAARLSSLTSRLLQVARLDHQEVKPALEVTDMAAVASYVVEQYRRLPMDRHISFVRQGNSVEAWADPELLRLALSQLLDNALKYSPPDSEIEVEVEPQGDMVYVRVSNSGGSIDPAEHTRIFERLYRGVEARRFTTGSGLGLYVARKIALAHGGVLDLDTQRLNHGVTFFLGIPRAKERD